jgi:TetR/AcrR family transcriptional repressor of mexJK operon
MKKIAAKTKGRPKDPEKRDAIMEVAGKLFLNQGYERTSVDTIADKAGVSKFTIYSHFNDKEGLFKCLVTDKCHELATGRNIDQLSQLPLHEALVRMADGYLKLMLDPDVLAFQRLMIADATNNPELMQMFYESGPKPTVQAYADIFKQFNDSGKLRIDDSWRAADHFLSMLRGIFHWRALFNVETQPGKTELRRHIDDCVAVFIRAYAAGDTR